MPPVPVLLVTGFLGAGKTTLVNHMLAHAEGRRIAAVVNDFGAIDIDAELITGATDGVVSLANGCICCSLEGDLLRTLAALLRRDPVPEAIVIETSGVADPADIVRNLMDPVVFRAAPLETVLCVVDASGPFDDPLFRAQAKAADIIALSRTDLAAEDDARFALRAINPRAVIVAAAHGRVPLDLLFPADPDAPVRRETTRPGPRADRFETVSWTADVALSLPAVRAAIGTLAPRIARAKGFFEAAGQPGRQLLLQFAGGRATLVPAGEIPADRPRARLVFIAELGALPAAVLTRVMDATRA